MEEEKRIRQEFAKVFGWYKRDPYSIEKEPTTPSWEQIFVEVGKLQQAVTYKNIKDRVSDLECKLDDLEKTVQFLVPKPIITYK